MKHRGQFRSRAKTSKEGNNGLNKKDWLLKKIFRQFLHWRKTRDVFNIVVSYTERFKDQINYTLLAGESNQSDSTTKYFFTFMKVRQNYRNLHLAKLFSCSVFTIANIVTPIIHVIHYIQFTDLITSVPSRDNNKLSALSSINQFGSCTTLRTLARPLRLPPQD